MLENIDLVHFCRFINIACGSVHKPAEKELDQYVNSVTYNFFRLPDCVRECMVTMTLASGLDVGCAFKIVYSSQN